MGKKIILDMDLGIDDAMALAYIVGNTEAELLGVTGTYGNVYVGQGIKNARMILNLLGADQIPVTGGLEHALCKGKFERMEVSAQIHGTDGIGNVSEYLNEEENVNGIEKEGAVRFILDHAKKYNKDLTLVTTGPLTNAAEAIRMDRESMKQIGRIVVMGGALTVNGNVTVSAEANIYQDPQAAKEVFESGIPVTMVGLDVTTRSVLSKEDVAHWRDSGSRAGDIFAQMTEYYIEQHAEIEKLYGKCHLHDPSAVICAMHPEWFQTLKMYMTVLTEGEGMGRTLGIGNKIREKHPNVDVCIQVDSDKVVRELNAVLLEVFKK